MKPVNMYHLAAVALGVVLAMPGCATMEVNAYSGRRLETPSRTYDWGRSAVQPTGDPRLDNNEFFEARVRAAVERQLAQRGWRKAIDNPGVLVHYHASVVQDLMFVGAETAAGYCTDCKPEVYDSGTLLIDIVAGNDDRLLWRGWAKGNVSGLVDNQKWLDDKVDQAVTQIFTKWPAEF